MLIRALHICIYKIELKKMKPNKNFNVAFIESVENKISDKTKETKYYQMLANSKYNENPKKQTYIMLRKEDVKL